MQALIRTDLKLPQTQSVIGKQWAFATQIVVWKGADNDARERGDILIHRVSDMNDTAQVVKWNT